VLWDTLQLTKLINMNHNKYNKCIQATINILNNWNNYSILLIIIIIKVIFKQWGEAKCAFKIFLGITPWP